MNKKLTVNVPLPLGLIFVILKLTHVIEWSWFWVLCPFWLPPAIVLGVVTAAALSLFVMGVVKAIID